MGKLEGTWKLAADVLDVSVDTAQRQHKASQGTADPMPVYQVEPRGRIRFESEELIAWQKRHPKSVKTGKK